MRFVPVKSIEQQSHLFVHRARQGYVEHRTALINRIRGLLLIHSEIALQQAWPRQVAEATSVGFQKWQH
jgi:transposase